MTRSFEHAYVLKQLFLVGVKTKGKFKECILYNKDIFGTTYNFNSGPDCIYIHDHINYLTTWSSLSKTTAIQPYKYSQCLHFPLSSNLQTIFPP